MMMRSKGCDFIVVVRKTSRHKRLIRLRCTASFKRRLAITRPKRLRSKVLAEERRTKCPVTTFFCVCSKT